MVAGVTEATAAESAAGATVSAGTTESVGSAVALLTIWLAANTLLTDTIATAAIIAKTNFFII